MKKTIVLIILLLCIVNVFSQDGIDANSVTVLPRATTTEMNGIIPLQGAMIYNTTENAVYTYSGSAWARDDNQDASEVNLATPVDSDGDAANETTVEDVVQAIAPITSASGRIFYPPSIAIDASTNVVDAQINLYTEYTNQFNSGSIVNNPSAGAIPIYAANELDYYVTYYDPAVFANITITDAGLMEYDIIGQPADYNSLINVVFVVK